MAIRYCGDLKIDLQFVRFTHDGRAQFRGTVRTTNSKLVGVWPFENLCSGVGGGEQEFDKIASDAVGFATYYTSQNRGDDAPDWAPSPALADEFARLAELGERGNLIRRKKNGPVFFEN